MGNIFDEVASKITGDKVSDKSLTDLITDTTPKNVFDSVKENEEAPLITRAWNAFKGYITSPEKVGRLVLPGGLAILGGVGGTLTGGPGFGTAGGGLLGYATGERLADIVYGSRLPKEEQGKPIPEMWRTTKDLATGAAYEALGPAINLTGKAIYSAKLPTKKAIIDAMDRYAEKQAAKRLYQTATKEPQAVVGQIEKNMESAKALEGEIPGLKFNLGQQTGDPNLLSLARQKSQQPGVSSAFGAESTMAQNEAISKYIDTHIRRNGNIDDFLIQIQKEQEKLAGYSQGATRVAEAEANRLKGRSVQDVGQQLLDKAERIKAVDAEKAKGFYNNIPEGMEIEAQPLWDKVKELFGNFDALTQRLGATPVSMMSRVKKAMKPKGEGFAEEMAQQGAERNWRIKPENLKGVEDRAALAAEENLPPKLTMKQFKDFRSQVSTAQREAIANKDFDLAYRLGQLKLGVNDALAEYASKGTGEGVEALKKATDFWRDIYVPKYRYGATGKILGIKKSGEQNISDSLIGEQYFKSGKDAADAAAQFKLTFGSDAEAKGLIKDYASQSLLKSARNPVTGELESNRITSWLYQHQSALDKFGLKQEFGSLERAMDIADKARNVELQFNKSALARALNVNPDKAIAEIVATGTGRKQSIERLQQMVNLARQDRTGAATEGLRAGWGDYFKNNIQLTARDLANNKLDSLAKMDKFMQSYRPALEKSGLYSRDEMKAFDNVHKVIVTISKQQRPHPEFSNSATAELFTRMAAAGASMAAGHLGTYAVANNFFKMLERPVKEKIDYAVARAVFDPRYAEAISGLIQNLKLPPNVQPAMVQVLGKQAIERFNKRLMSLGAMGIGQTFTPLQQQSLKEE